MFMSTNNTVRAFKMITTDHQEVQWHPVVMEMVPRSGLLLLRTRYMVPRVWGSSAATNQALALTTVIIKLHREKVHEICMGKKWIRFS